MAFSRRPLCADTVEKVFWGWRTKFSRAAYAFSAQRCEGPRRFSEKRPRTFVLVLCSIPGADLSKNQHLRDFWSFSIFDFFNSIRQKRSLADDRGYSARPLRLAKRAINSTFKLSIGVKSLSVAEREDLHHDQAGDPHRRIDPVISIVETSPCETTCLAAAGDGIDIDHVSKPPSQLNARKKVYVVR
jgi:hypothetical protein